MLTDVSVSISGPVLAFLLYENANGKFDQEGFLIGEVVNQVVGSISDSQICGEKVHTIIKIYSVLPCPKCHAFYNGIGKVKEEDLLRLLGGKLDDVVGWYRFSQNLPPKQFLRDRVLHREIAQNVKKSPSELFLTCRLGMSLNSSRSTHSTDISFYRLTNRGFEPISVHIPNLGDTSHTEYKTAEEGALSETLGNEFLPLVSALRVSDESYPNGATAIQNAYQQYLKNLVIKLEASEIKLAEAREALIRLEEDLREKEKLEKEMQELKKEECDKVAGESGDNRLSTEEEPTTRVKNEAMDAMSCDKGSPTESNDQSSPSQGLFEIDDLFPSVSSNEENQQAVVKKECKTTTKEKSPVLSTRSRKKNK